MNNNKEFEASLQSELVTITSELESIATKNPLSNDWVAVPIAEDLKTADRNNEADAVEEWNERRAILAQLEILYRNLVRALDKIATGTFGVCEISGDKIEIERLRANPAARTSIANIEKETELPL